MDIRRRKTGFFDSLDLHCTFGAYLTFFSFRCYAYYPTGENPECEYERFVVTLKSEEQFSHYIVRTLQLEPKEARDSDENSSDGERNGTSTSSDESDETSRLVFHFQFTSWPDFGILPVFWSVSDSCKHSRIPCEFSWVSSLARVSTFLIKRFQWSSCGKLVHVVKVRGEPKGPELLVFIGRMGNNCFIFCEKICSILLVRLSLS